MQIIKIILLFFLLASLIGSSSAAEVKVLTSNQEVASDESFDVNIVIDLQGVPISGAQLNLAFNQSILKVNSVNEGNHFNQNGASTFFNGGTINNSLGKVINTFDAIVGKNNISTSGVFIIINFTVVDSSGTSDINLSNVKISDPNGIPVALNVTNGSIIVNMTASDIIPTASVTDLVNASYAMNYINWTWTDPQDMDFAKVEVYIDGVFQRDVEKGIRYYNAIVSPGTYTIGTITVDAIGNKNATMATHTATTILPSVRYINGTIREKYTLTNLSGVSVYTNTTLSTLTDETGFYSFMVTEGTFALTATFNPTHYTNSSVTVSTIVYAVVKPDIELQKKPTGNITGTITGT